MEKNVKVGNIRINYLEIGAINATPIVLVHGFWQSHIFWNDIVNELSSDYKCIALDLPGFGKSDNPSSSLWSYCEYENLFSNFIDAIDIKNPIIIGHSFGAKIALIYASKNKNISGLVVYSAGNLTSNNYFRKISVSLLKIVSRLFPKLPYILLSEKSNILSVKENFKIPTARAVILNNTFFKSQFAPHVDYNKILTKTLLIYGKNDPVAPHENGEILNKQIFNSKLCTIVGASHFSHKERKADFLELLRKFLMYI